MNSPSWLVQPVIIQILGRFRPDIDGVTDYALQSAQIAREKFNVNTRFLVCHPESAAGGQFDGFEIINLAARSSSALTIALESPAAGILRPNGETGDNPVKAVVLQYSGYGFSQNGAPLWLRDSLLDFFYEGQTDIGLTTVFHELFATSHPWRKAFWYSISQRRVVRSLAKISKFGLCSIERNEVTIKKWAPDIKLKRLPIPPNIDEPSCIFPLKDRPNRLAIFGNPGSRSRSYANKAELAKICKELGVQEIWDIGQKLECYPVLPGVDIVPMGALMKSRVSAALLKCRYGFLYYPATHLAKSSVMGAYCAHGLVPIIPQPWLRQCDGLESGKHYIAAAECGRLDMQYLESVATFACQWQAAHSPLKHAEWYAALAQKP